MSFQRKWIDPEDFYLMRRRAGLSIDAAASYLNVTARTIRNWEQGKTNIPYACYRLLKFVNGYVFTSTSWDGWFIRDDTLYSPSQRAFKPHELTYLSNYMWMARKWLQEHQEHRKQSLVYAARHADCNLKSLREREGKLALNRPQHVFAPLKTGLNLLLMQGKRAQRAILVLRTLKELNIEKPRRYWTYNVDANLFSYTLCEVI